MLIYLAMIDSPEEKIKFEIIYEQYKNLMFYTANKILGDTRDSEDIVHILITAVKLFIGCRIIE